MKKLKNTNLSRRTLLAHGSLSALVAALPSHSIGQSSKASLEGYSLTRWRQDPFALGSYSYLAKNSLPSDRKLLAKSVGSTLFFAGEATNPDFPATVHGALISGRKAADDIVVANRKKVAVIGAGISGLAAAERLTSAGYRVEVFEARDRIGGRIWTDRSLGLALDMGASWIHGTTANPLSTLAKKTHSKLVETNYDNIVIRRNDGLEIPWHSLDQRTKDILDIEGEYGAPLADLSDLAQTEGADILGPDAVLPDGYDQLLHPLSAGLSIRLSSPIESITHSHGGASLTTADSTFEFDAVLVTVPLGVLKAGNIRFMPELPVEKLKAVERLGMGILDKVYLKFDKVFWDAEAEFIARASQNPGEFTQWFNIAKYTGQPVILALNAANSADRISKLSDEQIVQSALDALDQMYPGKLEQNNN